MNEKEISLKTSTALALLAHIFIQIFVN